LDFRWVGFDLLQIRRPLHFYRLRPCITGAGSGGGLRNHWFLRLEFPHRLAFVSGGSGRRHVGGGLLDGFGRDGCGMMRAFRIRQGCDWKLVRRALVLVLRVLWLPVGLLTAAVALALPVAVAAAPAAPSAAPFAVLALLARLLRLLWVLLLLLVVGGSWRIGLRGTPLLVIVLLLLLLLTLTLALLALIVSLVLIVPAAVLATVIAMTFLPLLVLPVASAVALAILVLTVALAAALLPFLLAAAIALAALVASAAWAALRRLRLWRLHRLGDLALGLAFEEAENLPDDGGIPGCAARLN
jgi:hypothetical protein